MNPAERPESRPERHPAFIQPMRAKSGSLPTAEGWSYELKWDGMRLQASVLPVAQGSPPSLELRSGSGRVLTSTFPDLASLAEAVDLRVVLDGELVVFDQGRPNFSRLQQRIHVADPSTSLLQTHPVVFIVFDLLRLDDSDVTSLPYHDRRRLLRSILADGPNWRVPSHVDEDGQQLLDLARAHDLEGIVAKRTQGVYRPNSRAGEWIKIKLRRRQDFVVGGWLPGAGGLRDRVGSLLVGVRDGGELRFAGAVGSGLTDQMRQYFLENLDPTITCPFSVVPKLSKPPTWTEPRLVIEVAYCEWGHGQHLRHPVFVGLRLDTDPSQVFADRMQPDNQI